MKSSFFKPVFLFLFLCLILSFSGFSSYGQVPVFSKQDSIRGAITPERAWWDLTYYHLDIEVKPDEQSIKGTNTIRYKVLEPHQRMQIDLQPPMKITKVSQEGKNLKFSRSGNAYFIQLANKQKAGTVKEVVVHYEGKPQVSVRPPWSGGLSWEKDANGNHFVANANQGDGASLWWPCKDHMYDEVDSMHISVRVPENLMDVSNGRLQEVEEHGDGTKTWHWFVSNPINNYGVNINIGDYVHFSEKYQGEKGELDCDYYVLRDNLEKANQQFQEVKKMFQAFEHWFGPYPFYEDGYKLVEVPYLGMEHQSSVTYGNGYQNGYLGRDLSETGWGMKFDFIIIHESGHEWFANNITNKDIADMWVHESFTAYSESLFLEYHFGKKAGSEYVRGTRTNITNDRPIIGYYQVNAQGSSDMYYKGANMLHTLRQIVNDDAKWRDILRAMNKEFYHQTVSTSQIENFLSRQSGIDLKAFFNQYLRDVKIPTLEYRFLEGVLLYRWNNCVEGFDMPVKVSLNGEEKWLHPTTVWKKLEEVPQNSILEVDPDFYVSTFNLTVP